MLLIKTNVFDVGVFASFFYVKGFWSYRESSMFSFSSSSTSFKNSLISTELAKTRSNSLRQTNWKKFCLRITFAHCLLIQLIKITSDTLKSEKIPFQFSVDKSGLSLSIELLATKMRPVIFPSSFRVRWVISVRWKQQKKNRIYYDLYLDLHARDTRLRSAAFSWKSMNKLKK